MEDGERAPGEKRLKEAIKTYLFLLNNNFKSETAINVASSKYFLSIKERELLKRCFHSFEFNKMVKQKTFNESQVEGKKIAIDYYNVVTTISEAIEGYFVFRCTDGIIRDLAKTEGRSKREWQIHETVMEYVKESLYEISPEEVVLVADKQVPFSGEYLSKASSLFSERLKNTKFYLDNMADSLLIKLSLEGKYIIASSDSLIAEKALNIFDLSSFVLKKLKILDKRVIEAIQFISDEI
ncbi:DUF434 domain-containing protein [Fervidicoccus sp.]|uniref:DUF434 domain-containing protein n=1 Tax=Fervidicoccus sp. TaxID=2060324 RepID=UPI003D0C0A35